jgi:hypothetical protein
MATGPPALTAVAGHDGAQGTGDPVAHLAAEAAPGAFDQRGAAGHERKLAFSGS